MTEGPATPPPDPPGADDPDTGSALARRTAVMATGTVLSRASGFLRVAAFAAAIGATEGPLADAYNQANTAPNIVYELILGGVLSSVLVPIFVETLRRDSAEHHHVANAISTIAGLVLVGIAVVGVVAAPGLAVLFTLRADALDPAVIELRSTITLLLRLFMPQVLFYGLTTIYTAFLNAHRHFALPMFAPVLNNLVVTGVLLWYGAAVGFTAVEDLSTLEGRLVWLLGLGTTAGIVAMTLPLVPVARRHGWRPRLSLDWRHPMVRRVGRLGSWTLLYVMINQVGTLVVILLAGAIDTAGAYSAYVLAFTFFQLPHGIYAVSVMSALLPGMADAHSAGDTARFRATLGRGIRATALLIVPAAVGMGLLAGPIVSLVMERGAFGAESTSLVAAVLAAFCLGLPAFSVFQLFLRAHYGLQDTRTPVLVNLGAVGLNTMVNLAAFWLLDGTAQVVGLAVGHAVAYWGGAAAFALLLRRRLGGLGGRTTGRAVAGIAGASATMGALVWLAGRAVTAVMAPGGLTDLLAVVVPVAVGVIAYVAAARVLGVPELRVVTAALRRR